jgi:hypothetical protein
MTSPKRGQQKSLVGFGPLPGIVPECGGDTGRQLLEELVICEAERRPSWLP